LSFSVSEKLARYGSSALSGVEHLTSLVGKASIARALICQTFAFTDINFSCDSFDHSECALHY